MKRVILYGVVAAVSLLWARSLFAQDLLVPAGTLLQCTLNEPNFSSATASVGDPVLCHLKSFQEFGRTVFPRGSMLAGHLEAAKEPGHFVGKGYLQITFDRVIVPSGDIPVPAKLISAKGYKVDKQGDVKGKGHPKRDVVEWMIPPLWPEKVLMLPARGPRPALKGEEPLQLRLMDDVVVPGALAHAFPLNPNRPPYASSTRPSGYSAQAPSSIQPAVQELPLNPNLTSLTSNLTAGGALPIGVQTPASSQRADPGLPVDAMGSTTRFTMLVLKSNQIYEVTKYRLDGGVLLYQLLDGTRGAIDAAQIDWRKTTEMTSQLRSVDFPLMQSQTN